MIKQRVELAKRIEKYYKKYLERTLEVKSQDIVKELSIKE